MPRLSNETWREIRYKWEQGATKQALAAEFGVTRKTIHAHAVDERWSRDETETVNPTPIEVAMPDEPVVAVDVERQELERRLAEAEAKLAELSTEIAMPVLTLTNIDELKGEALRAEAERALAAENRDRYQQGLPRWNAEDPMYQDLITSKMDELRREAIAAQTRYVKRGQNSVKTLSVKMVAPDGSLRQVISERHVNSDRGRAGDAVIKMRDEKGYKLLAPARCLLHNCWAAAYLVGGQFPLGQFCSPEHADRVPVVGERKDVMTVFGSGMSTARSRVAYEQASA